MPVGEAVRLARVLAEDQTSQTFTALHGWSFSASHEYLVLAGLFDSFAKVNFKNPQPYPRPWPDDERRVERFGKPIRPEDMGDVLRAFGRDPQQLLSWPVHAQPETPTTEPHVRLDPHE